MTGGATRSAVPDLTGRKAKCECGRLTPSSTNLAKFEYCGPGSRSATEVCVCGFHWMAHQEDIRNGAEVPGLRDCPLFRPRGDTGFDVYWCGCPTRTEAPRNPSHVSQP